MIHTTFQIVPRAGDVIRGDIRIPDGPPPRSAVVIVHGFKGFKEWGFFPYLAQTLAGAGHAVVGFDLSHNGVGEDLHTFSELDRFAANTLSLELDDVRFVLDQLFEGELVPRRPDRVGILGHSRGGGQAILAAGEDERIDAVVTWAAVSYFDRWTDETKAQWREDGRIHVLNSRTGQQMPLDVGLLLDYEANRERLDIRGVAARLDRPWLIVHGQGDATVFFREAETLASLAPRGTLHLVEAAGHTFEAKHPFEGPTPELEEAVKATVRHFERHLQG